ncbi:hypothetical protein Vafri_364 [Volvox africanus]|nr:hypothetical protein Vafri_364 [Volvox africanus]
MVLKCGVRIFFYSCWIDLLTLKVDTAILIVLWRIVWLGFNVLFLGLLPQLAVSDGGKPGVKMCRHTHWMGMPQHDASYIPMYTSLLRFRLGAWALEVNRPNGRLREQRWCRVCNNADSVEDEYHVVMECPAYTEVHAGFADLGMGQRSNMLQIMSMEDQLGLARIIHSIRMRRSLNMGRT